MLILIQSRNLEVDDSLKEYIEKQLQEIEHHHPREEKVTITLSSVSKKKNDASSQEVHLLADWPGENVAVRSTATDIKMAITDGVNTLDQMLLKSKEKLIAKKRG